MLLPNEIIIYLEVFFNPKVVFSTFHKKYLYEQNDILLFNEEYLDEKVLELLININYHLQNGLNNEEFLDNLLHTINQNLDWSKKYYPTTLAHFYSENSLIKSLYDLNTEITLDEPFTLLDITTNSDSYIILKESIYNSYTIHMENMQNLTNNFADPLDFEKSKVIFVYSLLKRSLIKINNYLLSLKEDFKFLDFTNFDFKDRLMRFDIEINEKEIFPQEKGNFTLSKVDVANLFYLLKEENILSFSQDYQSNNVKINRFIERNFTYKNEMNNYIEIKNINKEFSKIVPTKGDYHINFLKEFIQILEKRKDSLESK